MCLKRLFQLVFFGIITVVLVVMFAPSLIKGAGNALLSSVNNSTAQGFSSLVPNAQGKSLALQINVSGLTPNTNYFVTLDRDECGGQVLANVGKITTDASGATTASLSVGDLAGLIQNTLYLDIHQGADVNGQSVACGQVQINGAVASITGSATPTANTTTSTTTTSSATISSSSTDNAPASAFLLHHSPFGGFPNTGVAPARGNSYDNNSFPRKY
ncbi:MAG TPA: hypothetical protein VNG51_08190 [Ktedonobacteraceae bacterium]|nr:hypothetical protein [Ktedonobacteraceae bacterium]